MTAVPSGERADQEPTRLSRPVREAVRYIRANAREQVRLQDVAAAANLTPRGVQAAFQRELAASPMDYLRSVRLDGVHRDLQSAQPGERLTVAEVARRWRFTNVGRMAAAYRSVYGTAPSTTLRFLSGRGGRGQRGVEGTPGVQLEAEETQAQTHFRLVLDCEVEVGSAAALRQSIEEQIDQGLGAWRHYRPVGDADDLVAFVLSSALRRAVQDVDGMALRAVNPMVRVPDPEGDYPAAELPSWAGPRGDESGGPAGVPSSGSTERPSPRATEGFA